MPNSWIDTTHATSFVSDWVSIANCENFLREPSLHRPSSPPFFLYCSVVNPHPPCKSTRVSACSASVFSLGLNTDPLPPAAVFSLLLNPSPFVLHR